MIAKDEETANLKKEVKSLKEQLFILAKATGPSVLVTISERLSKMLDPYNRKSKSITSLDIMTVQNILVNEVEPWKKILQETMSEYDWRQFYVPALRSAISGVISAHAWRGVSYAENAQKIVEILLEAGGELNDGYILRLLDRDVDADGNNPLLASPLFSDLEQQPSQTQIATTAAQSSAQLKGSMEERERFLYLLLDHGLDLDQKFKNYFENELTQSLRERWESRCPLLFKRMDQHNVQRFKAAKAVMQEPPVEVLSVLSAYMGKQPPTSVQKNVEKNTKKPPSDSDKKDKPSL